MRRRHQNGDQFYYVAWWWLIAHARMVAAPVWAALPAPVGALFGRRMAAITSDIPGLSSPRQARTRDSVDVVGVDERDTGAWERACDGARRLWSRAWSRVWASARAARASATGVVVAQATGVWLATRVAYIAFTYLVVTLRYGATVHGKSTGFAAHSAGDIFKTWQQWDAVWYMNIAAHGYSGWQSTAFFPLYPLLIRLVSVFVGPHWLLAALIVSNLATWTGFVALSLLAMQEFGDLNMAWRVMIVAAAYPLAFFLTAPYTEGLFLTFAAFALYFARRAAWRRAAVMVFLATAVHVTGVILILPLLWEFARRHGWLDVYRRRLRRAWGAASAYVGRRSLRGAPCSATPDGATGSATNLDGDVDVADGASVRLTSASMAEALAPLQTAGVALSAMPATPATPVVAPTGAPVGGAVAVRRRGSRDVAQLRERLWILLDLALVAGAAPFAIFLYACYLWRTYGHPLVFYHAQEIFWQRQSMPLWRAIPYGVSQFLKAPLFSYWQARSLVDLAPIVIFGLLTLVTIRRIPFAFTLYMLGLIYLAISNPVYRLNQPDAFVSAGRFFVVAIPMFLVLGKWMERRRWLETLIVTGGFMLQAALAIYFLASGWLI